VCDIDLRILVSILIRISKIKNKIDIILKNISTIVVSNSFSYDINLQSDDTNYDKKNKNLQFKIQTLLLNEVRNNCKQLETKNQDLEKEIISLREKDKETIKTVINNFNTLVDEKFKYFEKVINLKLNLFDEQIAKTEKLHSVLVNLPIKKFTLNIGNYNFNFFIENDLIITYDKLYNAIKNEIINIIENLSNNSYKKVNNFNFDVTILYNHLSFSKLNDFLHSKHEKYYVKNNMNDCSIYIYNTNHDYIKNIKLNYENKIKKLSDILNE
jgi:hypothetical protein